MRRSTLSYGLIAIVLSGCSDGNGPSIAETTFAPQLNIDLASMTQTGTGLYYKDLVVGAGAVVANGQRISIHYVGNLPTGLQFDANSASQPPFQFTLGSGQVIAGFDQGVAGMHVGGKRQMIIPPALGYGAQAAGMVPPNSILVFTVDVVSAQ